MISVSEYQNITNAVRSHCCLIVSWQKIANLRCMVLVTKFYSKEVLCLFCVTALSFCTMRSRFGWRSARLRSATNLSLIWHQVHSFFLFRSNTGAQGSTGIPECVCLPEYKHNDVPSNRANTNCTDKAQYLHICSMTRHDLVGWECDTSKVGENTNSTKYVAVMLYNKCAKWNKFLENSYN